MQPTPAMPEHLIYSAKAINATILAGVAWVADIAMQDYGKIAQDLEGLPLLISQLGLPTVFLGLTIYALVYTNRALRASEAGRLRDREDYAQSIRSDAERAEKSREALRDAMEKQGHSFDRMADKLNTFIDLQRK